MTDLVYVLNNRVSDEINGCDQTIGLNQSSKDTVVIPDNGSQEQNTLDPNNDISPKKAGVFNSVKDTISSLESSFVTFKNDVDNNMQTILKNLQDLITTEEVFNDSNPTSKHFKLQTSNLQEKISDLEVHRLNLDDRVKQLEGKDKSNNKIITKLENTVRDLTNKLNEMTQNEHQDELKDKEDTDIASVSSVTSNNHSLLFVSEPYGCNKIGY